MIIIINIDSFVDLLTNSSTVIYTNVTDNAESAVKGIINEVLRAAKSAKTVDDLYEITIMSQDKLFETLKNNKDIEYNSDEYWEKYDEIHEIDYPEQVDADELRYLDSSVYSKGAIIVRSKEDDPQTTTISDLLAKIFKVHTEYG